MAANPQIQLESESARVEWHEGVLDLPEPFALDSGQFLGGARLAWQSVGPAAAPLIVVLGGISAHRRVCAQDGRGWFESQCGTGRVLDSTRYRVLGIDWLGGVDASTGPREQVAFPEISTRDQARALLLLLNRLGARRVHLLVGASYGGSVAQHLAVLLGDRLRRLVLLSAAHRTSQFGLALRHIQRTILDQGGDSKAALALARSLAVLGYRTPEGLEQRFGGQRALLSSAVQGLAKQPGPTHPAAGVRPRARCASTHRAGALPHPEGIEARFAANGREQVLLWLGHHGDKFGARFEAAAYRCLSSSIDTHEFDPASIDVPTTQLAVREDLIVPLSLLREYAARAGVTCELVEISSACGHDAFLKEDAAVGNVLLVALGENA